MSTITLPNIRVSSDLTVKVRLKDSGVAIDWSTLNNVKASIYSDAQRALAGRCDVSIDAEDPTLLVCQYAANKPQYVGVNRIVVSAKYHGETKTYDKPAFSFVRWTGDQAGEQITIDDPDVDVEIDVEDVSSSILDEAIRAAFAGAERANDVADSLAGVEADVEAAEALRVAAEESRVEAEEDRVEAEAARVDEEAVRVSAEDARVVAENAREAAEDLREGAEDDRAAAETARETAEAARVAAEALRVSAEGSRESAEAARAAQASADHTVAAGDHTQAAADHTQAAADHTTAASDHTQASSDHTQAAADHTTAAADHTQAQADHSVMEGYDDRLDSVESEVSQLEAKVPELVNEAGIYAGILTARKYSNDAVLFTNAEVPAGNTIILKMTFTRTSGAIRVFDANNNSIKTFVATGQTIGTSKVFDEFLLPTNYAYVAHISGYSADVIAEVKIKNRMTDFTPAIVHNDALFFNGVNVNNLGNLSPNLLTTSSVKFRGVKNDVVTTSMPMYRFAIYDADGNFLEMITSVENQKTYTIVNDDAEFFRIVFLNGKLDFISTVAVNGNVFTVAGIIEDFARKSDVSPVESVMMGNNSIVVDKVATIPPASSVSDGYMSREDKAKLDGMSGQTIINISGSGVSKNASAYGFLPTKTGAENSVALQSCLDGGGLIVIDLPGIYEVDSTHYIDSNTHLVFGENVYIKRVLNSDNKCPRHIFVNRGAFTYTQNDSIIIENLKILPNGYLEHDHSLDVSGIIGLRGLLAFFCISNLVLDGVEVIDHEYGQYSIHICNFENIECKRIHIETLKDGIHLGPGRNYVIKNCQFLTDDDAIALNAIDYPGSNAAIGWIEDGIVENITFIKKPTGSSFRDNRGVLMLSGAWKEWASGMSFQTTGDCVMSNGRIYQTYLASVPQTPQYLTSTSQPTHTSGKRTYPDGLTWVYKGESDVLNAGIRRVHFKDLYFYRKTTYNFLNYCEQSPYVRSFYPSADLFKNEGITFEGIYNLNESGVLLNSSAPVDKIKFINNDIADYSDAIIYLTTQTDVPSNMDIKMAFVGNSFASSPKTIWKNDGSWSVTMNLVGSLQMSGFSPVYAGISPTFVNNDLT